jgi:hypothetical protein
LPGVGNEEAIIHLLLLSAGLNQTISRKLAVAEILQDFALLLGFAKDFELAPPQVLQLAEVVVVRGDSAEAHLVCSQLKLHFRCGRALTESRLRLNQRISPINLRLLPLLLRLNHLASDGLEPLALAMLEAFAKAEHGL